ncbi:hypothetical protein [Maledivibacter halophilus]|uniref:Uncharacterized protein n=1 Tax=Maledivibacter halophilus TaxID=36842 RepID=A0A1T5JAH0_9FIRM|nr:hypothetical protein [Maledivibacter halophilus]SKC48272.1 hypothetical protein SAMN02194393_01031 [Maledivibacter halophilus]
MIWLQGWHSHALSRGVLRYINFFYTLKYGLVGTFSFLYYVIYEMLSCLLEVVGVVFIILAYFFGFINIQFFVVFMLIYVGYSFIECFGYRQISSLYRLSAIFQYRKKKYEWGKIHRKQYYNRNVV